MDASQWPQHQQVASFSRPMEDIPIPIPNNSINSSNNNNNNSSNNNNPTNINNNNSRASNTQLIGENQRKSRLQKDQNVNCPRCNSTNTKFCYYNNYSLTQPRYFCKTCRRYWTQGGSLRNVPVGGGSRKNKRSSSSSLSSSSISTVTNPSSISISMVTNPSSIPTKLISDLNPPSSLSHLITTPQNPNKFLEGQNLNLAFPIQGIFHTNNNNKNENNNDTINVMNVNNTSGNNNNDNNNSSSSNKCNNSTNSNTQISALELIRTGITPSGSLNPYIQIPIPDSNNTLYPSSFPNLQDFKPEMNVFSPPNSSGCGGGGVGARLLFPFVDMNKLANTTPTNNTSALTTPDHQHHEIDHDQIKGGNDHHHDHHNHHQASATGYWSGMLGGGTW